MHGSDHVERPIRLASGQTYCSCGKPWPCDRARATPPPYDPPAMLADLLAAAFREDRPRIRLVLGALTERERLDFARVIRIIVEEQVHWRLDERDRHRLASFTCPACGMTSHHPTDAAQGYCGNCHDWTGAGAADLASIILRPSPPSPTGTITYTQAEGP